MLALLGPMFVNTVTIVMRINDLLSLFSGKHESQKQQKKLFTQQLTFSLTSFVCGCVFPGNCDLGFDLLFQKLLFLHEHIFGFAELLYSLGGCGAFILLLATEYFRKETHFVNETEKLSLETNG